MRHIESLQLNSLVGVWKSASGSFDFISTNQLVLQNLVGKYWLQDETYNYSVTPRDGSGWSIFISDRTHINTAIMAYDSTTLVWQLIDPSTGDVVSSIVLNR